MKTLVLMISLAMLSVFGIFVIETEVGRLPDTNKFKIWWRKHMVGEEN
jgi:hypothetical protein